MSAPTELPADPKSIKKLEKDISKERQNEEKIMQSTFRGMYKQEKSEAKASKAVEKAEKAVKKLEKHEMDTAKSLRAATHKHDTAVTNLHSGQADLYAKQQQAEKLRQDLANARQRADQVSKDKQAHDRERENRLSLIHAESSPPTTAGGSSTGIPGALTGATRERSL